MRTWLGLVLAVALVGSVQAVTWNVITNSDCTGAQAATAVAGTATVECCNAPAAGGGNECEEKTQIGQFNVRLITFGAASGSYTNNGDALTAAAIAKIGLNTIVFAQCQDLRGTASSVVGGPGVAWFTSAAPAGAPWGATIRLNQSGAGQAGGSMANTTFTCELWGR